MYQTLFYIRIMEKIPYAGDSDCKITKFFCIMQNNQA